MEFCFASESGLQVSYRHATSRCFLHQVDSLARGVHPSENATANFPWQNAVDAINKAGWTLFKYQTEQIRGKTHAVTDLFGACLYLATLPGKVDRRKVYEAVAASLTDKHEYGLVLMEKATWKLNNLYTMLPDQYQFPAENPELDLPEHKMIQFTSKLQSVPLYKGMYNMEKTDFVAKHASDDKHIALVAYPGDNDQRVWACQECNTTLGTPIGMARHMAGHEQLHGITVTFGTARFQTKKKSMSIITSAIHAIQRRIMEASEPKSKRNKGSPAQLAAGTQVLELLDKMQASSAASIASLLQINSQQSDQVTALIASNTTRDEMLNRSLATNEENSKSLQHLTAAMNSNMKGSISSAEDIARRIEAFQETTGNNTGKSN